MVFNRLSKVRLLGGGGDGDGIDSKRIIHRLALFFCYMINLSIENNALTCLNQV
jgi:hypothetical protein